MDHNAVKFRNTLIDFARSVKSDYSTISYKDLVRESHVDFDLSFADGINKLSDALTQVFEYEMQKKREGENPLLTILATSADTGKQGDKFFTLLEKYGYGTAKKLKNDLPFLIEETRGVIAQWKNEGYYQSHK